MAVLQGMDELDSQLKKLELHVRAKLLMSALKKNVEPVREEASVLAPVLKRPTPRREPGTLKGNIIISAVQSLSNAFTATVRVGPSRKAFYGLFQEVGTKFHGKQQFLGPAGDAKGEEVLKQTAEDYKKAVESFK